MNSSTTSLYSKMFSDAKLVMFKNKKVLCFICNEEKSVISKGYRDMCSQCFHEIIKSVKEYEDEVEKNDRSFSSLYETLKCGLEYNKYTRDSTKDLVSIDREYSEDLCNCEGIDSDDSDDEKEHSCYCYEHESSESYIMLEELGGIHSKDTIELVVKYQTEGYSYRKVLVSIEEPKQPSELWDCNGNYYMTDYDTNS